MCKQLVLSGLLLISLFAKAATPSSLPPELKKDYDEFQRTYEDVISSSDTKQKFLKEFKNLESKLQKKYNSFDNKEGLNLSAEGNQMALDIEMLEPLKIIAEGNASSESCKNAEFINELNNQSDAKTYKKIKQKITTLCK